MTNFYLLKKNKNQNESVFNSLSRYVRPDNKQGIHGPPGFRDRPVLVRGSTYVFQISSHQSDLKNNWVKAFCEKIGLLHFDYNLTFQKLSEIAEESEPGESWKSTID